MASKINKSDLGYLGSKTQKQIVKTMIENPKWLSVYLDCIKKDKDLFTVKYLDKVIDYSKEMFENTGRTPMYEEIAAHLKVNVCKTDLEYEECKALIKELKSDDLLKGNVGETSGMDALRKAEALYLIDKTRGKIENSVNFDEKSIIAIQEEFGKLGKASNATIQDTFADDILPLLFSEEPTDKIPTGIPELDAQLNGGIPRKQLAMLIAATGVGKTTLGSIICNGAARNGYNVMQIVFEDSESDIARKHVAHCTGAYISDLYGNEAKKAVNELYANNPGFKEVFKHNLRIVHMPNTETTVEHIRNYILNIIAAEGWKPDMIFIDYLSSLMPSSNATFIMTNESGVWERCVKKIEKLAHELGIVIWVAQQTNRNGVQKNTVNDRIGNIQGSFRAVQPCSFVLYLDKSSQNETRDYNRANLYLDKCRGCCKKEWENIYLNNGNCQIDLSDASETLNDDLMYN